MGVEFGSEAHEAAIAKILASAKKAGKTAAIFCASAFSVCSLSLALLFRSIHPLFDHERSVPDPRPLPSLSFQA